MAFKSIQASAKQSLLDYFVSGKAVQYHSAEKGYKVELSGLTATGGVISDYTDGSTVYRAHIFTSSGTFNVTAPGGYGDTIDIFAVGGGGGGGGYTGAGGGGGGAFEVTSYPIATQNYSIVIGSGGAAFPSNTISGIKGGNTTFTNPSPEVLTALGGGGGEAGGSPGTDPNADGGSGGGGNATGRGSADQPSQNPGVANLTNYGNLGGTGVGPGQGGGGGAGGAGTNGSTDVGGAGGSGTPNVYAYGPGSPVTYAGGGGGGRNGPGQTSGGSGGGGSSRGPANSDTSTSPEFSGGLFSTGGGGGGGDNNGTPLSGNRGGNGGSGIVVVRYQIGQLTAAAKATGGAISYYGGKTIHTFTSSGTFASLPTWSPSTSVEYVVVAGGGAAGQTSQGWGGGGGGAGGYLSGTTPFSGPFSFAVNVGAGGAYRVIPTANPGSLNTQGPNGTNSTAAFPTGTITSYGGGGGGKTESPSTPTHTAGSAGGSGGGGSGQGGPGPAPYTPPQGNTGGSGSDGISSYTAGGGGGGAGGSGGNAGGSSGGAGGIGVQVPTTFRDPIVAPSDTTNPLPYQRGGGLGTPGPGGSYYLAGGGGGAHNNNPGGAGGAGGGGRGGGYSDGSSIVGIDGVQSTGSGGGGIGSPTQTRAGGGGSGIVLIAYPS